MIKEPYAERSIRRGQGTGGSRAGRRVAGEGSRAAGGSQAGASKRQPDHKRVDRRRAWPAGDTEGAGKRSSPCLAERDPY